MANCHHMSVRMLAKITLCPATTDLHDSGSIRSEHIAMPAWDQSDREDDVAKDSSPPCLPEQPKDRPFAALIEMKTTAFPQRFQAIMQDEDQTAQQRATALRAVLKMDLILVLLYFGLVILFLGGTLFQAISAGKLLPTRGGLIFGYCWFAWSKAIPALALSVMLMWDALRKPVIDTNQAKHAKKPIAAIQCNQVVNVTYVGGNDSLDNFQEKKAAHAAVMRRF